MRRRDAENVCDADVCDTNVCDSDVCDMDVGACPDTKADTCPLPPSAPSSSRSTSAGGSADEWSQVSSSRAAIGGSTVSPCSSVSTISRVNSANSAGDTGTPPLVAAFFDLVKMPWAPASAKKLLQRTLTLLDKCDYGPDEACAVLAHASAYFDDIYKQCGHRMVQNEIGYIMVVLIYIAHCFVLDEACPLKHWHQHLCTRYCSLTMLDEAVLRLMKMRNYKMRLSEDDLEMRYSPLFAAAGLLREEGHNSDFWLHD